MDKPILRLARLFNKVDGFNFIENDAGGNINIGILDSRHSNALYINNAPSQEIEYYAGSFPTYENLSFVILYNGTNNYYEDSILMERLYREVIAFQNDTNLGIIKLNFSRPSSTTRSKGGIFEWIFEVNGLFTL